MNASPAAIFVDSASEGSEDEHLPDVTDLLRSDPAELVDVAGRQVSRRAGSLKEGRDIGGGVDVEAEKVSRYRVVVSHKELYPIELMSNCRFL